MKVNFFEQRLLISNRLGLIPFTYNAVKKNHHR